MIELSRDVGQSIMIGDIEVIIKNINIATKQVCVVISAPKNISVYRTEAYETIKEEAEKIQSSFF